MSRWIAVLSQRRLLPVVWILLGVVVAGYVAWAQLGKGKIRAFYLQRGELIQTVVASGRIETPARVDIGTQVTGRVATVPVKEGQTVKAGDVLIQLDATDEIAALEQANAAVHQAEVKLRQLHELTQPVAEQARVQAEATLSNVQKQFDRSKELVAKGFVGQAQLDDAQRNLDVARSQYDSTRLQALSSKPSGSDYQLATAALEQAKASAHAAQAKLDHTRIIAVADGVLISRDVERGDIVQPGKVLMVLSPVGLTQLLIQIDEKNLRYLQIGQTAQAMADAYPGQRFPAQLVYINPGVNAARGSVDIKLNVPEPPAFLKQDMTVSVEIVVARRKDALSLSVEAIHDALGNAPWVMMLDNGKARKQAVQLGVRGDKSIEILSGLTATDIVLPATGVALTEGQHVHVEQKSHE